MATEPPKIGLRIRRAMEKLRMNQQQLADVLGVSRNTVNSWINDKAYPANSIGALEHVLDVDLTSPVIDELFWLPGDLKPYRDDPVVKAVVKMDDITIASKISLIRHAIEDREQVPLVVRQNTGDERITTIWGFTALKPETRLAMIRAILEQDKRDSAASGDDS